MNSINQILGNLPATSNSSGWSHQGQSQTSIHSMVSYWDNNNDDGPVCRPHIDPNFGLFHLLMSIAYSGCNENKLIYHSCQHEKKILNSGIMAISKNLSPVFDTTRPCAIFGKVGCTFEGCEKLQNSISIRKYYFQINISLQKIKGIGANQGWDVNFLCYLKLSHVNSVNLLPPQSHQDIVLIHHLEKLEDFLAKFISATNWANRKINLLTARLNA